MNFLPDALDHYINTHSEKEPELLSQLDRETNQKILQPRMLSGHYQGRLLSLISKLLSPETILEIGTYTGYASICLAEGLPKNGKLHTIDINEELVDFQTKYFKASGYAQKIKQYLGDATEIIPNINANFDLWSGKVLEKVKDDDESTKALQQYNKMLAEDPRVETVMLPVRDGLSLSRVK